MPSDDNPQENGLHGNRPPKALCKPQGSVLQQWAVSLEQVSHNRIITTNTYEWKEHSCSSMLPLINATSVYIYHTLKKDKSNNIKT